MNSIGISLSTKNYISSDIREPQIDLHLNLWKSSTGFWNSNELCLDIGIKAKFKNNEIKIYLPFELSDKYKWEDLGHVLADNKPILCSLFNDDYNVIQVKSGCYHLVSISDDLLECESRESEFSKIKFHVKRWLREVISGGSKKGTSLPRVKKPDAFYLYPLGEDDVTLKRCVGCDGAVLSIEIPNQEGFHEEDNYYIRFRVYIRNYSGLALKMNLSDNLIQSAFTRLDMYNIQINEKREIPYGPKGMLTSQSFGLATFSKIHILYISSPKVTVENGSSTNSDSRIIELNKWQPYLPSSFSPDTYVAHHWKFVASSDLNLKKANLFFSARYPQNSDSNYNCVYQCCDYSRFCGKYFCIGFV